MKSKHILFLAVLLFISAAVVQAKNDKPFSGKITFQVEIDSDEIPMEARAMLPKVMNYYIGEMHTKSELFTQMGTQSSIENLVEITKTNLLDIAGQKFAYEETTKDLEKEWAKVPETELEFTGKTKTIAGYTCKQVIARKTSDGQIYSTGWYTDELIVHENINYFNPVFREVSGLFLEFDMEASPEMKMKFTAMTIEKVKVKDNDFIIPEGYQVMSQEELMQMFGG
jgi:hypothetical protein